MKKLKKILFGFILFNCLSIVALAVTCPPSWQVGNQECPLNAELSKGKYCVYICPNGVILGIPKNLIPPADPDGQ